MAKIEWDGTWGSWVPHPSSALVPSPVPLLVPLSSRLSPVKIHAQSPLSIRASAPWIHRVQIQRTTLACHLEYPECNDAFSQREAEESVTSLGPIRPAVAAHLGPSLDALPRCVR